MLPRWTKYTRRTVSHTLIYIELTQILRNLVKEDHSEESQSESENEETGFGQELDQLIYDKEFEFSDDKQSKESVEEFSSDDQVEEDDDNQIKLDKKLKVKAAKTDNQQEQIE